MRKHLMIVPALVLIGLLQGCVLFDMHRAHRDDQFTTSHSEGSSLMISSRNGSIEVVADPTLDEVLIDVRLTCGGSTQAEAQQRVDDATLLIERDTSRMLTIMPVFPGGPRNGDGAKIIVHLPDAYGANLTTGNGSVVAKGLSGTLIIETSNGRVIIENHAGEAQIRTSNGRIEVSDHGGPLEARTSNGRITVSLDSDQVGPINLRSSNGSIRATVGREFTGRVTFDTSNGKIHILGDVDRITQERLRKRSGYVIVGSDDGPESLIDTSNGSIELVIRDLD